MSNLNVVGKRDVLNLNIVERPLVEELDGAGFSDNIGGKLGEALVDVDLFLLFFDFNFNVRHGDNINTFACCVALLAGWLKKISSKEREKKREGAGEACVA